VYLPGGRRVSLREVPDPRPGPGQVVLDVRASTICGSDLRAIYREHLGEGPEAYQDVVAGHEPCGQVVAVGPDVERFAVGDRAVVYHISGCGQCDECRRGYQISCTSSRRRAYGWQRDGGHAERLLADERDLLVLPEPLTFLDGACVACGFATAYEALSRVALAGGEQVLVTGLGPVGLAAGMLASAMGSPWVVGTDPSPGRRALARDVGAVDVAVDVAVEGSDDELHDDLGDGAEVSVDCSGVGAAQLTALRHTRRHGRCALVGEGATLTVDVSAVLIHRQLTVHGSWVAPTWRMAELLERLVRWDLHPERVVTDRFALADAARAYEVADAGARGKVGIVKE
jgi:threonine dehydrogenase-like Zn-dependent dehydrogenase